MYNKTLSNNNNDEVNKTVIKLCGEDLAKSLYYRDEGNVSERNADNHIVMCNRMQLILILNNFDWFSHVQMNIVVSLFAQENDEKRVIRFKKIPADDKIRESIY